MEADSSPVLMRLHLSIINYNNIFIFCKPPLINASVLLIFLYVLIQIHILDAIAASLLSLYFPSNPDLIDVFIEMYHPTTSTVIDLDFFFGTPKKYFDVTK